jgi:hypothetical protein
MVDQKAIRKQARKDLVVFTEQGQEDVYLWDRSVRVTESACKLAMLPELAGQPVNLTVLLAAGLYHDAGWIAQLADGVISRRMVRSKRTTSVQRELGAAMMTRSLRGLLGNDELESAAECIRSLSEYQVNILEAQLIAEADSLDEFGALCLWHTARKYTLEGKGPQAAIDTWETQRQYGYWTARINDSFRFETVKRIAYERLAVYDKMIDQLRRHNQGEDLLAMLSPESQDAKQAKP